MNYNRHFIILQLLFSISLCEISVGQKEKLLNGFISFYNNLPGQLYKCDEGSLENTQQVDETTYEIVANLKVKELNSPDVSTWFKCTAKLKDSDDGVTVENNHCEDQQQQGPENDSKEVPAPHTEVKEEPFERKPIKLENEVQSDTALTSGEQFIAIPRDQPHAPCVGCASHVSPQAAGVSDLANLGIRHLDIHEPSVKHTLDSVLDVERQVQVVNGVRYILTLSVNKCSELGSQDCATSKICKITILVKPWVKLPNGKNYRAILANNCTEEWQYGDEGEVLPEPTSNNQGSDDDIVVKNNKDLQTQPNQQKTLSDEEIRLIQDQIIPNSNFEQVTVPNYDFKTTSSDIQDVSKQHVFKLEANKQSGNSIPVTESVKTINQEKKKAIDEMLDFFDFSGFKPKAEFSGINPRIRRSYENDLQVLSLAEDYHKIKKSIENAKFVYEMAQAMVDYLNEMDIDVKSRVVQEVIKAEEETENFKHFVYVQARVTIPCDKVECEPKEGISQICNGVIDSTNEHNPQILNTFCYNSNKEKDFRDVVKDVYIEDPVLQTLAKDAVKIIESESKSSYAIKINKIVAANTQTTSGTLTKISIIIENLNCNKSVPFGLRINCTVLEQLGSKICEVLIHERYWLQEKKISYTCTDRPVDMKMSNTKSTVRNITVHDPKIIEMLQEAIQYLETQSNKNNKQKIVNITSISTQIVAGLLTKLEFIIGYTNCTNDDDLNCELLENESLRTCKAQIWDRSWIIDGKQIEVLCNDMAKTDDIEKTKKKRSIDVENKNEQNVNNITYQQLAEESLKKLLQSSSSKKHYVVVKVEKVKTVSGMLTLLDFTITPTNCLIEKDGNPTLKTCEVVNVYDITLCHSKILGQIWLYSKQFYVSCDTKYPDKKNIFVGLKEHDATESKYYQLANESLTKYFIDKGISRHHRIVRVEKATTQIVSGLLTSIDFIISPKESNNSSDAIKCHTQVLEKHWLKSKDYDVTCEIKENRSIDVVSNPDDQQLTQIAVESLQEYIKHKPDSQLLRVTFVDKATIKRTGINVIEFLASHSEDNDGDTFCHAEFLEKSSVRNYITVKCYSIGTVLKKSKITEEDPNYFQFIKLAEESLKKYLQSNKQSDFYTIASIENINVIWDKGIKTEIKFIVSPIGLENNELRGLQCTSQIREQSWLNKKYVDVTCAEDKDLYRVKRQLDHVQLQDPNDPKFKALADESLQKYLKDNAITEHHVVDRVLRVTTQVVSGSLTRLDFVIIKEHDLKSQECHSEVWEKPWLSNKIINVSCSLLDQQVTRQDHLVGGQTEHNPNDPTFKSLADESLQKYLKDNNIFEYHKVDRVESVTTQVVSGSLTRLDFVISNGQNLKVQKCHSKVWEQPWLDKKEITVSCSLLDQRVKRQDHLVGGQTEHNPNDPKFKSLADESLQKYLIDNAITEYHKVDRVVKVTTQVVSGSLTRLDFTISNGQDLKAQECHSEVLEQPWLNNKEIKVSCSLLDQQVTRQDHLVGGQTEHNPNDPTFKSLADESLQKYLKDNAITEYHKVDRVVKVTTQVVSGSLTRLDYIISNGQNLKVQKCHSKVWEQPWLNKKEITVSCSILDQQVRRQNHLPGGQTEHNPNDPTFKSLADESLQKYLKDNAITEYHKVDRVVKVTTQVVSGSLTRLDFTISNGQHLKAQECHSEVLEQPWLNNKEIKVYCSLLDQQVTRQDHLVGGQTEHNPNDPTFKSLADESLQKYLKDNAITEYHKVDRVVKVTTQVVSGSLTRLDFTISNGQDLKAQECHSEVLEQPWLNNKEIKVSCSLLDQQVTRQDHLVGGQTEHNPNDPTFKSLADESLQKYLKDNAITEYHKVDRVVKVTTQVVSGSLTRLDFTISNGQDLKAQECHSEVWEQPWLNNKEIKVSCSLLDQQVNRDVKLKGGQREQNPDDPKFKVLADESLQKYLKDNNIFEYHKVDRVESVTTQVVSGSLTRLDFVISNGQNLKVQKCHSKVWEQPWLDKKEITVSCSLLDQRVKRQDHLVGGQTEHNPNDPKFKSLADESLQKYLIDNAITEYHKVDRVVKVTTQVVSGSLTRLDFTISNGQDLKAQECHSEVLEQPWLNNKEIKVSCSLLDQQVTRQDHLVGGQTEHNPNDPTFKSLADESLQKYLKDNAITEYHKVDRVVKVTTQVVSGSLTRLDYIISNGQNLKVQKCHSKVWEQPWLNKKEITVSCSILDQQVRRQNHLPGGQTEHNPNDPTFKSLADESLQKYLKDNAITEYHKVDRVVKVTTQVVSGSLTRLDFTISNGQHLKAQECHSEVLEQPWLNNKEIKVYCSLLDQQVTRQDHLVGGQTEHNPNDPTFKSLADESLQKYLKDNAITEYHKVDRVVKVTTQVVSGSLTRLDFTISNGQDLKAQECHSEVLEQPWLNNKEIKVSCSLLDQQVTRQDHLVGGQTEHNPNDPTFKSLADESLQKYLKDNAITEYHKVDRVVKVTTQVVSGSLTRLDFTISNGQDLKAQECHSEVWEQPWLNNKEIKVSCSLLDQQVNRDVKLKGGQREQNPDDPKFKVLADESLQKYLKDNNIFEYHKVDRVESVTTQVVSGSLTRLDFVISNGQNLKVQKCHSKVWEQPWLDKKEITVSCSLLDQRVKRQDHLVGGQTEHNPNDPTFKSLADESLQKYLKDNAITEYHKVDRVVKVTTQVVSGSLTRLDFTISNGQDLKAQECHSEVLEQPWLNNKEIKVSCSLLDQQVTRQDHLVGGQTEHNPNDPTFKSLADESLQKYLKDNAITEYHKVDRVVKVTTQVVSGSLTRLDFTISNGQDLKAQECHSEVWEQPWLNNKEIKVSCSLLDQQVNRDVKLKGGQREQNPDDPKFKVLADESLQKYLKDNNIFEYHKVDRVESVTTQVVSGSLTRLDFVISNGQNLKVQKCHSKVWEQPWLDKKEITVSCSLLDQRVKRQEQLPGSQTVHHPNDPKFKALADESLQKYLKDNAIIEYHKVDRVVKVTTQVVSGSLTRLDFTISNGQDLKTQECHSEVLEQPWLNNKEIKVSCSLLDQGVKRQDYLVGGQTEHNPNDPTFKSLADESLQKYLKDNAITEYHKVDRVVKVTTQVVSGSLTRLDFTIANSQDLKAQECHSEVWEQPWLNNKEIKVSCSLLDQQVNRDVKLKGAQKEQNPDDPKFKVLADESLQKYLKDNDIFEYHKVDRVESVTTQVVSGSLTRLDFVISNGQNLKVQKCHSKVWEQPWLDKKEITVSCSLLDQRGKRQEELPGSQTVHHPNDPKFKTLADESLQKYLKDNAIIEYHKVDRVLKVTTQVVSGSLTRLDFTISNGQDLKTQECHSEVLEQPWLNNKEIKVSCSLLDQGVKRQDHLVGGQTEHNPNDPTFKSLADESLQKYLKDNAITEYHKIDRVVKVATQVVSGSLTRLDFIISNGQDLKAQECHSEVLEQPWLNNKEIKVSCSLLDQQVTRQDHLVGGQTEHNPNDPTFKSLADESLQKYLKDNAITEYHKVDRVVKVTTQVVSGSLTRLDFTISNGQDLKAQECHSEVWEQPWLNNKEIKVSCSLLDQQVNRDVILKGGQREQNPDDPKFKVLADESLQKYLKDNDIFEYHKVDRVESVTTQVVSGSLTRLDFVISNGQNLKVQKCHSKVWEQPWLDIKEITVSCSLLDQRGKRQEQLPGSQTVHNPYDPKFKALADESLQKYLKDNAITEYHKVDRVVKVTTQVVSGSLTRLDFTISNGQDLKAQECHSEVLEQPWLNNKEIKVSCSLLVQQVTRHDHLVGGQTEHNPNDPTFKSLADESLQKYLKDNAITEYHKVDRVVKVTTQVVSGSLTRLDFTISNGQDLKAQECHSELWEQPWLNNKEIKVSCSLLDPQVKHDVKLKGGQREHNPNDPKFKLLADESLQKYLKDNDIFEYHKVDRVESVTTQVVSGSLTRLDFVISNGQNLKVQKCHSKVWEQPWLDKKEITVSCSLLDQRETRQDHLVGGQTEHNPNDPTFKSLADESLQKYLKDNAITEYHKVDRVVKVTTQVVSGSLTRLDFTISNGQNLKAQECHSEVLEQPWLNNKEIKVSCSLLDQGEKRQDHVPGGQTEHNPNDPTFKSLAVESLQKYLTDNAITEYHKVDRVVKVTTQVVSGSLTRLDFTISNSQDLKAQECHSEVWEQPWLNNKEIKVSCSLLDQQVKRQDHLPGGQTDYNPNDPKYKALADESLQKYLKDNAITEYHKVDRIVKVTTQIVSGSLTRLDFVISNGQNFKAQKCNSKVWEQPWLNKKEITVSCSLLGQRVKRHAVLGVTENNPKDPKYKALADESLLKYLKDNAITEYHKVDRVVKVTTQVVAGSLTRLDFTISNGQNLKAQKCHSEVWEQPLLNKKEITVSCSLLGQRVKRHAVLGVTENNPKDPKYKALADESLLKYLKDNAITEYHKVDRVVKVTTQVVAGSLTRLDFTISNGQNLKAQKCHSEVWEQPLLNKKEITVSCSLLGQRVKRHAVLGVTENNPKDPKYKALADESLLKYLKDNAITEYHKVDRVVKVTTQVVAGSLTRLDFTISNGQNLKAQKCHSEVWEQPLLNKKEITVSCSLLGQRVKRHAVLGVTENNPKDPKYKALADESLLKYLKDNAITEYHKVDRVVKVTTQVVAGSLTRLDFTISNGQNLKAQKCHSEVWEQPLLNKKEITVSCSLLGQRVKRHAVLGVTENNPKDPKYKALADESLLKYLKDNAITEYHKVDRVVKVTTQVVAGSLTRLDFTISNGQNLKAQKCHSEVWEQPLLNKKEITVSCSLLGQRVKRHAVLGVTENNPKDPKYKALADESLLKYLKDNAITEYHKVDRVVKVTTQVVAGSLTRLDFTISNGQNLKAQKCHSEVWEQPLLNKKEITVSCSLLGQRVKRHAVLGVTENNPKDPKYKALADESLLKYLKDNAITEYHKVDRVVKVTTQVVAGSLTRLDFTISNGQNLKAQKCHSEVWEQPLLNKKEITVSCSLLGQRVKRHAVLGVTENNPKDPKYKALADESLLKYLKDNAITEHYEVDRVLGVTTQVTLEITTRLDFVIIKEHDLKSQECHSAVVEKAWLNYKTINVSCVQKNRRRKRDLNALELNESAVNGEFNNYLRGNSEEEQDAQKAEFKLLAEESLRKFQIKSNIHHKVLEVKRVVTRVVSGIKYKIDFSAAPTTCAVNVSNLHRHKCKVVVGVILYCHSEIWDRPWLKQKKIDVQCYGPDDNDFDEYETEIGALDDILKLSGVGKTNENKYKLLAEEASEKYLSTSNRKYVHRVAHIHSVSEHIADGNIIKLEFSMSPTKCLRNETRSSNDTCEIKLPLTILYCTTKIWDRPWLHVEKDIKITCKKLSKSKKYKRELGARTVRQTGDEDDIDEDTTYYYADRAVQHVNDQSSSNNLHKLVTIHAVQNSVQMKSPMIRMYIELAETYCLRHHRDVNLHDCEEMNGLNHRLCLARLWPSPDDELVIRHVSVICDDDEEFTSVTALNIAELLKLSIERIERSPENHFKLIHQGEPQVIPVLDSKLPVKLNFIIATTNCSKNVDLDKNPFQCFIDSTIPAKACHSFIWMEAEKRTISFIDAKCPRPARSRRSPLGLANVTADNLEIQNLVTESLEKLEMSSLHRYKQRVLRINSHSTKITSGKVTSIDFDVGYTSCLKYEWVENITSCDFLEHLPRRRCVAQIFERLWINNGRNIDVNCVDDETPLESHIEFESAEMANQLAREALKHIEAKYPHPKKQKVVRIFSLEKQVVAGIHYRMKVEVGFTDCVALSEQTDCKLENDLGLNKFCRVNVWLRPWTDHPPNFRVSCDYQEGATLELYHHVQAEHLFYNFLTTYSPSYVNDYSQMQKRFEIFKNNVKKIHELNVYDKGTARYGVTRFTDLTYEEFSTRYMGLKTDLRDANQLPMKKAEIPDIKIPQNFDWREYDAVTDVKDQGSCGSCWAFSVTGNIEGQWKMQSGQLVSLSEQELVDCDKLDNGCNGGLPDNAYRAIEQLGGLELELDYPYEGEDDKCLFNKTLAKVQISGAVNITTNETGMAQWLVHNGPISIGINANAMQFYMGGISHPWKMLCNPSNLDHGVLIVGYGVKDYPLFHKRLPYWIVKNSWGKSWGEQGYYRVFRGDGTCGVNQMASSAVI